MYKADLEKQKKIEQIILSEASQTSYIVFSPPSHVLNILADHGIDSSNNYIVRAYARLGIRFQNGLWKRSTKGESKK